MANILGELTINEISVAELDDDPRLVGVDLPVGSIAVDTNNGHLYTKTGALNINWEYLGPRTKTSIIRTGDLTTTSTTNVLLDDLSITPLKGEYNVSFYTVLENNNNNKQVYVSVYKNGVLQTGSEIYVGKRNQRVIAPATITNFPVTVNGSEAIEIRWRVSGGTGNSYSTRFFTIEKIG